MNVKYLLLSVFVVMLAISMSVTQSNAKIDPGTIVGM